MNKASFVVVGAVMAVAASEPRPAMAADASIFALRASATYADGSRHSIRRYVSGVDRRQVDLVRRTRSSVTVGYPSARIRRREHVKRCASVTFRLRLNPQIAAPAQRARELVPNAFEEGSWTRAGANSYGVDDVNGVTRSGAWRFNDEIVNSTRYIAHGAAVAELGEARKRGLAELTMSARMTHSGSLCGGPDESFYSFGIDELTPLRLFE